MNIRLSEEEYVHILENSRAEVVIFHQDFKPIMERVRHPVSSGRRIFHLVRHLPGRVPCDAAELCAGEDVPWDSASVGEIIVRGDNVMKGYWEMPEETEKAIRKVVFVKELPKTGSGKILKVKLSKTTIS